MSTDCTKCVGELDHCHGTLVVHLDGLVDCTDAGCADVDQLRHALVIDCDAVIGCPCAAQPPAALRRVS